MPGSDHDYGELVVLRHHPAAGLADLEPMLDGRADRRPYRVADLGAGDAPPDLTEAARGVLVLDGPMSATATDEHPWLWDEVEFLLGAWFAGAPLLGIGLGSHLLALALGGKVARSEAVEAGFPPLECTPEGTEDRIFAGWPDGSTMLVLRGDEITHLPDGAVPMLTGTRGGVAAWRAAEGVYGVRPHPEAGPAQLAAWRDDPDFAGLLEADGVDADALIEEAERRETFTRGWGVSLVGRWIDFVVGADDPVPG